MSSVGYSDIMDLKPLFGNYDSIRMLNQYSQKPRKRRLNTARIDELSKNKQVFKPKEDIKRDKRQITRKLLLSEYY